jgi:TatD DNase family protein
MLIDSHCHLNFPYEGKQPADLVADAKANDVGILVTIGTDQDSFEQVRTISETFHNVYHTIGIHPHDAKTVSDETYQRMRAALVHTKCVAMGEIGLDYFYDNSEPAVQRSVLAKQLEIAIELKKPLVIHSRDGESDLLPLLQNFAAKRDPAIPCGVIHCFTGTPDFARACIDLGFNIGISGIFTFKKSQALRDVIRSLPLEKLVVETDAPFLAPEPHRGKKCMPFMVRDTAMRLAELFGVPYDVAAKITTENSKRMFQLT